MNLFPYQNTISILPFTALDLYNKLSQVTQSMHAPLETIKKECVFLGRVNEEDFIIVKKNKYPEHFLPLIVGKIEATSKGCILLVKYKLFPSALLMLLFFCSLILAIGIFLLLYKREVINFLFLALVSIGIYILCIMNFNQKVAISKKQLENILTDDFR